MDDLYNIYKNAEDPSYKWCIDQLNKPEHRLMHTQCESIRRHFLRNHAVDSRVSDTYTFNGKVIVPEVLNVNILPTIENFHTSFTVGDDVTLTGSEDVVKLFSRHYTNLHDSDFKICKDLIKYGNSYFYTFRDGDEIKEKVFNPCDSTPIYDTYGRMKAFVERIDNKTISGEIVDTVYLPSHVDTYLNGKLVDTAINMTGMLPVHVKSLDEWHYSIYGDSFMLNLINILDKEELILSKTLDATRLSTAPLLAICGTKLANSDAIKSVEGSSGLVLNLEEGSTADWLTANTDIQTIQFLLKELERFFCMIGAIPSSIVGQSNSSNLSAESVSQLYQLTENRAKQSIVALKKGFKARWKAMRTLLTQMGENIADESFKTLDCNFNLTKPIDVLNIVESIKRQYDIGGISQQSVVELSPITANASQEIERLKAEMIVKDE